MDMKLCNLPITQIADKPSINKDINHNAMKINIGKQKRRILGIRVQKKVKLSCVRHSFNVTFLYNIETKLPIFSFYFPNTKTSSFANIKIFFSTGLLQNY